MSDPILKRAYDLLKSNPRYLADARDSGGRPNTIVGAVLAFTLGHPRWATEAAVICALEIIAEEEPK